MSDNPLVDFGKRVRSLRVKNNFTIEELAFYLGIKVEDLTKIENGEKTPDLVSIPLLSSTLNVSLNYLINGKEHDEIGAISSLSAKLATYIRAFEELADEYYCSNSGNFVHNCCVSSCLNMFKDKASDKKMMGMVFVGLSLAKYGFYPLNSSRVCLPIKKEDNSEEYFEISGFVFGAISFYLYGKEEVDEWFTSFLVSKMNEFDSSCERILKAYVLPKESQLKTAKSAILKNRASKDHDVTRKYLQAQINYSKSVVSSVNTLQEDLLSGDSSTGYLSISIAK